MFYMLCYNLVQGGRRASPYLSGQNDSPTSNVVVTPSQTLDRSREGLPDDLGSSSDESTSGAFGGRVHRSLVLRRVSKM